MNVLYKKIDWSRVDYVGFDMDGTLYDEFDFIVQAYSKISKLFDDNLLSLDFMLDRWLKKGSSYSKIFDEVFDRFELILQTEKDEFIEKSLSIFRNFNPKLTLCRRTKEILKYYQKNYKIFLVTDGNYLLQEKKFISLGLDKYFNNENIVFTEKYRSDYAKPNTKALELLSIDTKKSVFFGDRDRDMDFALNSGMQFQKVYNMIEVGL